MQSSNPVLTRLGRTAAAERAGHAPTDGYTVPSGYGLITPTGVSRPMTLDDVVTRTLILVGLTVVSAALSWLTLQFSFAQKRGQPVRANLRVAGGGGR